MINDWKFASVIDDNGDEIVVVVVVVVVICVVGVVVPMPNWGNSIIDFVGRACLEFIINANKINNLRIIKINKQNYLKSIMIIDTTNLKVF